MQPEQDKTAFNWIRDGRDVLTAPQNQNRRSPDWPGVRVAHLIPPIFEAYAKILHRVDAHYEFIDNSLSPSEIAILKIPTCEPLKSLVEQRRSDSRGTRIKWYELAGLLGVPFAPEICHDWYLKNLEDGWCWPRLLHGPSDGTLSQEELTELISTLESTTEIEDCFCRFSDIPFYPSGNEGMPQLFKGTLNRVAGLPKSGPYRCGPEYWWPKDTNWCACSEYDLKYTFIGGSRKLIAALLTSGVLECIEVKEQTRVDPFAPMPR